jgi:hypothetical protein
MTTQSRTLVSLLAGAVASLTVACGSGSSPVTGPAAATGTPPAAAAAAVPPTATGATIAGIVQAASVGAAALGNVHALSSSLRVSVVGTSLTTLTDGAGRFALSGVPPGHAQLRFEGPGIDARLDLDGLEDGQTLDISVHVAGSEASTDDQGHSGDVELSGKVESVGRGQLVVAGKTIIVNGGTRILDGKNMTLALSDIKMGDSVDVEGTAQPDGSILASKIKLDADSHGGTGQQVEFHGKVTSVGAGQLVVAGKTVLVDTSTRILGGKNKTLALADIKMGDSVDVEGSLQSNGSILASKIELDS